MKLLRYGPAGGEKPGMLDGEGRHRDLSSHLADIGPDCLSLAGLAALATLDAASLPLVEGSPRLGVPVSGVGKFLAIELNYADHAAGSNLPIPEEPVVFTKAITSLTGPNHRVMLPRDPKKSDWEVGLGIVIGSRASYVEKADALDPVAGSCTVNYVSEREYQIERGVTWDKGKGCDTFGPVGACLMTRDEVLDPQAPGLWLDVDGVRRQTGTTGTMIFGFAEIVSYLSGFITLMPDDIATTGTPPGVGMGIKPEPVSLKRGDVMTLGIDGLGEPRQDVVPWRRETEA